MKLSCAYLMLTCVYCHNCRIYKNIPLYNNPTMCYYNLPACGTGGSIDKKVTIVKIPATDKFMYITPFSSTYIFPWQYIFVNTVLPLCNIFIF